MGNLSPLGGVISCYSCKGGYYQTEYGATNCTICPAGYICPNTAKDPVPCTPGHANS